VARRPPAGAPPRAGRHRRAGPRLAPRAVAEGRPEPGGGGRGAGPATPRATSTTSYIDRPVTHRLENVGERLFRAMVVVNETHGHEGRSVEEAGFAGTPELTNPWFRAYRIVLAPGEASTSHRHQTPSVLFQVTPGSGLAVGPATFEFNELGQWAYFDAGHVHEVRNTGSTPLELIEVEVRQP
jgi:oxalate decarboxylase/phosphoglucose isomerase-like protein (cupin superfamily)